MKRSFLFLVLALACGSSIAACSAQPVSTPAPNAAPNLPTRTAAAAPATASNPPAQPAATIAPTSVSTQTTNSGASAPVCATDQHAPLDAFRPDSPGKLTASARPKFVEFYAVW